MARDLIEVVPFLGTEAQSPSQGGENLGGWIPSPSLLEADQVVDGDTGE